MTAADSREKSRVLVFPETEALHQGTSWSDFSNFSSIKDETPQRPKRKTMRRNSMVETYTSDFFASASEGNGMDVFGADVLSSDPWVDFNTNGKDEFNMDTAEKNRDATVRTGTLSESYSSSSSSEQQLDADIAPGKPDGEFGFMPLRDHNKFKNRARSSRGRQGRSPGRSPAHSPGRNNGRSPGPRRPRVLTEDEVVSKRRHRSRSKPSFVAGGRRGRSLSVPREAPEPAHSFERLNQSSPRSLHLRKSQLELYIPTKNKPKSKDTKKTKGDKAPKAPKSSRDRSPNALRDRSPKSPRSKSPKARRSKSPKARRSKSPKARRSKSPKARRSKSPKARRSKSPKARRSKSPKARRSKSPNVKRDKSPKARRSKSPKAKRDKSLKASRSKSPKARRSKSPKARRDKSPKAPRDRSSKTSPRTRDRSRKSHSEDKPQKNQVTEKSTKTTSSKSKSSPVKKTQTKQSPGDAKKLFASPLPPKTYLSRGTHKRIQTKVSKDIDRRKYNIKSSLANLLSDDEDDDASTGSVRSNPEMTADPSPATSAPVPPMRRSSDHNPKGKSKKYRRHSIIGASPSDVSDHTPRHEDDKIMMRPTRSADSLMGSQHSKNSTASRTLRRNSLNHTFNN